VIGGHVTEVATVLIQLVDDRSALAKLKPATYGVPRFRDIHNRQVSLVKFLEEHRVSCDRDEPRDYCTYKCDKCKATLSHGEIDRHSVEQGCPKVDAVFFEKLDE
jgi:hypothetical protein